MPFLLKRIRNALIHQSLIEEVNYYLQQKSCDKETERRDHLAKTGKPVHTADNRKQWEQQVINKCNYQIARK